MNVFHSRGVIEENLMKGLFAKVQAGKVKCSPTRWVLVITSTHLDQMEQGELEGSCFLDLGRPAIQGDNSDNCHSPLCSFPIPTGHFR